MSARVAPACHLFRVNAREQILVAGGRVFDQKNLGATATAVVIEIPPGPPAHSFEEAYQERCVTHLMEKTREAGHKLVAGGGTFLMPSIPTQTIL